MGELTDQPIGPGQKLAQLASSGLLLLVAIMPFHAFLTVWVASFISHRSLLQSWKELVIVMLMGLAAWQVYKHPKNHLPKMRRRYVYFTLAYVIWAVGLSLIRWPGAVSFAFGIKTDLLFLGLLLATTVLATKKLASRAATVILATTSIVVAFGTLQAYLLPKDFLVHFGYGPSTIAPYLGLTAYTTAFRILSTLGGPNQLGCFLILPLCLLLASAIHKFKWWQPLVMLLGIVTLWHTYSRSAWIGTAVALTATIILSTPSALRRRVALTTAGVVLVLAGLTYYSFQRSASLQNFLLHGNLANYGRLNTSDGQRLDAQNHALSVIKSHPLGLGLGTAGPASFHSQQPIISENYYLQIAIELGIPGLVLFLCLLTSLGRALYQYCNRPLAASALASLIGISIVNLFLHGWADSSTALVWAIAAGASMRHHD